MDYCSECKTRECTYIEFEKLLDYLSKEKGMNLEIIKCPDKENADYTCDIVLNDTNTEEKIYVEIKEVKFGFSDSKNSIGENNGQSKYVGLVSDVIRTMGDEKIKILNEFIISVPKAQIDVSEEKEFCDKIKAFIDEQEFEEDMCAFIYKHRKQDVRISFHRKSEEVIEQFGESVLFCYETDSDNNIVDLMDRFNKIDVLDDLLMQNANNTSKKKFGGKSERKILLNILKIPTGYEVFMNISWDFLVGPILERTKNYNSAANENYLLYYCNDYYRVQKKNGVNVAESMGEVLFIVPLIGELIKVPIMLSLNNVIE